MPNILDLTVLALATWRLSSLFTKEYGPWGAFRRLREAVGIVHDPNTGEIIGTPETFMGGLLSCVWCCSVYAAALLLAIWEAPAPAPLLVAWLALSGLAILMDVTVGRLQQR